MIIEMRTYLLKPTTLKRFLDIYDNEINSTHLLILTTLTEMLLYKESWTFTLYFGPPKVMYSLFWMYRR